MRMLYCPGAVFLDVVVVVILCGWSSLLLILVVPDHFKWYSAVEAWKPQSPGCSFQQQQRHRRAAAIVVEAQPRQTGAHHHHYPRSACVVSAAPGRRTFEEPQDDAATLSPLNLPVGIVNIIGAQLTAGESWIRLPVVLPTATTIVSIGDHDKTKRNNDCFAATTAALERLLVEMFNKGWSRGDSFEDNIIVGVAPRGWAATSATSFASAAVAVGTASTLPPPPPPPPDQQVDWSWSCILPAVDHAHVSVQLITATNLLVLSMNATNAQDFGWVCSQFYSQRQQLTNIIGVDCETSLRKVVAMFFNELPPDRGTLAQTSAWSQRQIDQFEKSLNGRSLIQTLDETGYIVMDGAATAATLPPHQELSNSLQSLLLEQTDQGDRVRTDRVLFVSTKMATACGLGSANTFLRGLAHYLNQEQQQQQKDRSSTLLGSTAQNLGGDKEEEELLTLPDRLQFAEYGHRDFYKAHRDNSLTGLISSEGVEVRSNFRAYTCILYLNDDEWDTARDGGALRIYPGTEHKALLSSLTNLPYVDVCPGPYGRLLVFDSRAIHSVEPVLRTWGRRRALTLWINRPVKCDLVPGETYF